MNKNPYLKMAYLALYETLTVFHLIVPTFYWIGYFLGQASPLLISQFSLLTTISQHGIDFIIVVFEIIFSKNILLLDHLFLIILFPILYYLIHHHTYGKQNTSAISFNFS